MVHSAMNSPIRSLLSLPTTSQVETLVLKAKVQWFGKLLIMHVDLLMIIHAKCDLNEISEYALNKYKFWWMFENKSSIVRTVIFVVLLSGSTCILFHEKQTLTLKKSQLLMQIYSHEISITITSKHFTKIHILLRFY